MFKERNYEDKADIYSPFVVLDDNNTVEICDKAKIPISKQNKTISKMYLLICLIIMYGFYNMYLKK